ncbi:hypothetical protein QFC21_005368 [Naganishia friedmannii]|uniref:Uncharacterized protein n=1 Tax=Naganishia friedmannii TaxID=89922 RepID=A0ACC2VA11_9TREE|nr:hypothetical protein QFC21_005368 [Naganishia friedmannii]
MCTGLACALAMKAEKNAAAFKMLNSTTETMPVQGFYIPEEELDRRPLGPCAYAAPSQSKEPAMGNKRVQMEIILEAVEIEGGGKAGVNSLAQTRETKVPNATEASVHDEASVDKALGVKCE